MGLWYICVGRGEPVWNFGDLSHLTSENFSMRKLSLVCFLALGLLATSRVVFGPSVDVAKTAFAQDAAAEDQPVEADMHEFMEYVCEPPYKRLKAALATAPADNAAWKGIKSDSLILAEAGNLLLRRPPEKDAAAWVAHSKKVRDTGALFYAAAKKKDAVETRKQWEGLLENCHACHTQFADGEHMLKP